MFIRIFQNGSDTKKGFNLPEVEVSEEVAIKKAKQLGFEIKKNSCLWAVSPRENFILYIN